MPAEPAIWRRRRGPVALASTVALAVVVTAAVGCDSGGSTSASTSRPVKVAPGLARRTADAPNFLVILMDDQADNSFKPRYMPQTFRWIVDPGTDFVDGVAAPPLCCPDRAGFLTGDYPHNSGVFSNHPGYSTLRAKGNTLPVWLSRAGYRTAAIGKYLNHYYGQEGLTPAPGWGTWFVQTNEEQYYDYTVSDNGVARHFGSARRDYSTDVFTRHAIDFLHGQARARHPFFLWLPYNAPHGVKSPGPGCGTHNPRPPNRAALRPYRRAALPKAASFDERDVSDKPEAIRKLPRIDRSELRHIRRGWRCTLATMSAADRDVGRLMRALKRTGELGNTIVFYMSDNGFYFGEHRIFSGKQYPYEPGLLVPYAVRVPARFRAHPQPSRSTQVVSNEDATATVLDYANGIPSCKSAGRCRRVDGRSARPLLGGGGGGRWPANRGVLAEIRADQGQYSAIRTRGWIYIRYDDGESELYDLRRDPNELRNVAGRPTYSGVQSRLRRRLASLRRCTGARGVVKPLDGRPLCE